MHDDTIINEFSGQADGFNRASVANAPETTGELVRIAAPQPGERWIELASGPGIVARALAPHVGSVEGLDLTPAMVELARREAAGLGNVTFSVGDATAIAAPDDSYDGAVARFVIHHMPVPVRLVEEMARVVRPGGKVVLADHLGDDDADGLAWATELERLRDPSHWASLPLHRLRALGGLTLEEEAIHPVALDFDDWLARGSGGPGAAALIERLLAEPKSRAFSIAGRTLTLQMWLARFRV
jgi:SAM-dependent methyltransferase